MANSTTWLYPDDFRASVTTILTSLFYGSAFTVGAVGNGLIIYIVAHYARMRTMSNVFLASLAMADLMLVCVCIPVKFVQLMTYTWTMGLYACKLVHCVQTFSAFSSVLTLTVMSIERYYAIIHPVQCHATFSMRHIRKLIFFVWFFAFILASPTFHVFILVRVGNELDSGEYFWCVKMNRGWIENSQELSQQWNATILIYEVYMISTILIVPAIIMIFTYSRICSHLWTVFHYRAAMRFGHVCHLRISGFQSSNWRASVSGQCCASCPARTCGEDYHTVRQVIKMLVAVIVLFVFCWTPTLLFNLMRAVNVVHETNEGYLKEIVTVTFLLSYLNSVINPIIYGFMSNNFRRYFFEIFANTWNRLRCKSSQTRECHSRKALILNNMRKDSGPPAVVSHYQSQLV